MLETLRALSKPDRVEIGRTLRLLQQVGPTLGRPFAEPVTRQLSAIRARVGTTRWRLFCFAHRGRDLVLLHLFAKKTPTMPHHEIALAEQR